MTKCCSVTECRNRAKEPGESVLSCASHHLSGRRCWVSPPLSKARSCALARHPGLGQDRPRGADQAVLRGSHENVRWEGADGREAEEHISPVLLSQPVHPHGTPPSRGSDGMRVTRAVCLPRPLPTASGRVTRT